MMEDDMQSHQNRRNAAFQRVLSSLTTGFHDNNDRGSSNKSQVCITTVNDASGNSRSQRCWRRGLTERKFEIDDLAFFDEDVDCVTGIESYFEYGQQQRLGDFFKSSESDTGKERWDFDEWQQIAEQRERLKRRFDSGSEDNEGINPLAGIIDDNDSSYSSSFLYESLEGEIFYNPFENDLECARIDAIFDSLEKEQEQRKEDDKMTSSSLDEQYHSVLEGKGTQKREKEDDIDFDPMSWILKYLEDDGGAG